MPDSDTPPAEFVASLTKAIVPLEAPVTCGAKVTVKGTLCPAAPVTGKEMPLTEYPFPFQLAVETVTAAEAAVNVPVWSLLLPTVTLPKLMVTGATVRLPVEVLPPPVGVPPGEAFIFAVTQPTLSAPATRSAAAKQTTCGRGFFVGQMSKSICDTVPLFCRGFLRTNT